MIETILIIWVAVYVLWVLSLVSMDELQHLKAVTISYFSLPFLAAFAIVSFAIAMAIVPIFTIFSSGAKAVAKKSLNERL